MDEDADIVSKSYAIILIETAGHSFRKSKIIQIRIKASLSQILLPYFFVISKFYHYN